MVRASFENMAKNGRRAAKMKVAWAVLGQASNAMTPTAASLRCNWLVRAAGNVSRLAPCGSGTGCSVWRWPQPPEHSLPRQQTGARTESDLPK